MDELLAGLKTWPAAFAEFWNSIEPRRRWKLVGSGVFVLAALSAFVWAVNRPNFKPLYTGLSEAEAGVVTARLEEMETPYRLAAGGTTILAPEARLDEIRLRMASQGLPQSGRQGFEIFDQSSFGATEFAEHVNYRRAIEGELERSIASLAEVRRARVHVSLPRRSVFLEQNQPAKASIVLELEAGRELAREQIRAVSHLVASAVEGLDPGHVVVMDHLGKLLSAGQGEGEDLTQQQLAYRAKLEAATAEKILRMIEPYVGPGGARANVSLDVNWDAGEQTEEILDPNTVVMTTQRSEERSVDPVPAGPPGAEANLPRQPAVPEELRAGMTRTLETTNYQTSRTVTKLNLERGGVRRMSVAVLVDHRVELDEEKGELTRLPRAAAELERIRELAVAAAGAQSARGDTVTVESLPFTMLLDPPRPPQPPPDPADQLLSLEWFEKHRTDLIAAAVGVVLLGVLFAWFKRRRRISKIKAQRQAALESERKRLEVEEAEAKQIADAHAEEERMLKGLRLTPMQTSKTQVLKKHLEEIAGENPEACARLIRVWLHEDD